MISRSAVIALVAGVIAVSAQAQVTPPARGVRPGAAARLGQPPRGRGAQANAPVNRVQLEQRVRQALARVARRQLGLNDTQMTQLRRVDMRFDQQRRQLLQEQRQNRQALKAAMTDSAHMDQAQVSQHMDKLLQLEHRRIDLLEAEQKELATFLTPLQRAQYQSLQERLRQRLENTLRANAAPGDSTLVDPPLMGRGGQRRRPLRPPTEH